MTNLKQRERTAVQLPSGGVPIIGPNLSAIAPADVQERVAAERAARRVVVQGLACTSLYVTTREYGGGANRITLPTVKAADLMAASNARDRAGAV